MRAFAWLVAIGLGFPLLSVAQTCAVAPSQLQALTLAVLRERYPDRSFAVGDDSDVVVMGEVEFGLQNLHADVCQRGLAGAGLRDAVAAHFAAMMASVDESRALHEIDWSAAQDRLVLQLMPAEYAGRWQAGLIHRPFAAGVSLGVVIDGSAGYRYATVEDAERWRQTPDRLFARAAANLEARSSGTGLQGADGGHAFLAIEEKDGFDAVRIMLPRIRAEAARILGDPFYAAVPNRDFLILWSAASGDDFRKGMALRVGEDHRTQPHPLSETVLRVWSDGRMEAVSAP